MSDKLLESTELVSALADGHLRGDEFVRALDHLADNAQARETWDTYNLVGDVMRSGRGAVRPHDPLFVQRLRQKMSQDTTVLIVPDAGLIRARERIQPKTQSANDPWWRRVAGFASVAMVGVLAWQGYQFVGDKGLSVPAAQLAQTAVVPTAPAGTASVQLAADMSPRNSVAVAGNEEPAMMIRDPRLDALLAAHRQFGGTSALQMPSGFLRNATFEEGTR